MRSIEYTPEGGKVAWRIEDYDGIASEFGVEEKDLPLFHGLASNQPGPWRVLRMLYGINPLVVPIDTDADFLKMWSRHEVAERLQISQDAIQHGLDTLLSLWTKMVKGRTSPPMPVAYEPPPKRGRPKGSKTAPLPSPPPTPSVALDPSIPPLEDDQQAVLDRYGFSNAIFFQPGRDITVALAERDWFLARIIEIQEIMDEPAVSSLARGAVMNELHERRLQNELALMTVTDPRFESIREAIEGINKEYREQWEQIKGIVPWANRVAHKSSFAGVLSDIIKGYMEYKADPLNKPLDGIFTALEIQVMMRESIQSDIRYRPGQVAAILEAMNGVNDPNWERSLPERLLKQMDAGFKEGCRLVREQMGTEIPDLERDDSKGEYPPLFMPTEPTNTTPVDEPVSNIVIN